MDRRRGRAAWEKEQIVDSSNGKNLIQLTSNEHNRVQHFGAAM